MRTFASILANALDILQRRIQKLDSADAGLPRYQKDLEQKQYQIHQLEAEYESGFL